MQSSLSETSRSEEGRDWRMGPRAPRLHGDVEAEVEVVGDGVGAVRRELRGARARNLGAARAAAVGFDEIAGGSPRDGARDEHRFAGLGRGRRVRAVRAGEAEGVLGGGHVRDRASAPRDLADAHRHGRGRGRSRGRSRGGRGGRGLLRFPRGRRRAEAHAREERAQPRDDKAEAPENGRADGAVLSARMRTGGGGISAVRSARARGGRTAFTHHAFNLARPPRLRRPGGRGRVRGCGPPRRPAGRRRAAPPPGATARRWRRGARGARRGATTRMRPAKGAARSADHAATASAPASPRLAAITRWRAKKRSSARAMPSAPPS